MTGEEQRPRIIIRRRRSYSGNHRLGVWKLAYADLVTAMMAFFMVMWLLTQADLKLRSQIAMYFRAPGVLPGGAAINEEPNGTRGRDPKFVSDDIVVVQSGSEEQALKRRAREIKRLMRRAAEETPELASVTAQLRVDVGQNGLTVEVVDTEKTLLFDVSSAELKPQVAEVLRRIAPVLAKLPNTIEVGGHTDGRPFPPGSTMSNWQLAFQRADNARRVLETSGLRPGQLDRVISFADTEPLVPDPLADENRRLSILAVRRYTAPAASGPVTDEIAPVPKPSGRG